MASSSVRLRGEGIRSTTDRLIFSREARFRSVGTDNPYNYEVDNSLVCEDTVGIGGNLTISSPGALTALSPTGTYHVLQTVRVDDTSTPQYVAFRAAASGIIVRLSAVYYQAESDDDDVFYVYLSDGAGAFSENKVAFGPVVGGWAAGAVDTVAIEGGVSNPVEQSLRIVTAGSVCWLLVWVFGTTADNDCTVVVEIDTTSLW